MTEICTPAIPRSSDYRSIIDLLEQRCTQNPEHIAFDLKKGSAWTSMTLRKFLDQAREVAAGLISAGFAPGERVMIWGPTSYEWTLADVGIAYAAGVVVPVYPSSSAEQCLAIAREAKVRFFIVGDGRMADQIRRGLASEAEPLLIWTMESDGALPSLDQLRDQLDATVQRVIEERVSSMQSADAASIVYTSGTSGTAKGVIITHENFLSQVLNVAHAYREVVQEEGNTVIFLPLAHVLARGLQMICLAQGMRIAHAKTPAEAISALPELNPTFLVLVPRVLEKIQERVGAQAKRVRMGRLWDRAQSDAIIYGHLLESNSDAVLSPWLKARLRLWEKLFYERIKAVLGGRISYVLSGGAQLKDETSLFFRGIGIPVVQGYGLTETTAPITGHRPHQIRAGTVGIPLPGSCVRLKQGTGEIQVRGPGVVSGYTNPSHTYTAFEDGWFNTGDLGQITQDGHLKIIGRVDDRITTSYGKSVDPGGWERALETHELIAYAVMIGQDRPFATALIIPDPENCASLSQQQIRDRIHEQVTGANLTVSAPERCRHWELVWADLTDPSLFTPTLKLRRSRLLTKNRDVIERMYSE